MTSVKKPDSQGHLLAELMNLWLAEEQEAQPESPGPLQLTQVTSHSND